MATAPPFPMHIEVGAEVENLLIFYEFLLIFYQFLVIIYQLLLSFCKILLTIYLYIAFTLQVEVEMREHIAYVFEVVKVVLLGQSIHGLTDVALNRSTFEVCDCFYANDGLF